ncbi:YadA C-terminal domain-containing protein [Streptobacillus moniliformis]|uniref:YadA C-terminal domain-containing protein n=1 Tax=Streptobacillus moniliformis TaxID=34105 RepID=UPI0007E474CF|nr:YadA C-terminal domain-containing protein [Streptobacillus moniliformis]
MKIKKIKLFLLCILFLPTLTLANTSQIDIKQEYEKIYNWLKNVDNSYDIETMLPPLNSEYLTSQKHLKKVLQVKANKNASNLDQDDIDKWKNILGVKNINFSNSNGGIASALATATTLKNIGNDKHTLSASLGYYNKSVGASIVYSTHFKNFGVIASASFNSNIQFGAGAGFSYTFGKTKNHKDKVEKLENKINELNELIKILEKRLDNI